MIMFLSGVSGNVYVPEALTPQLKPDLMFSYIDFAKKSNHMRRRLARKQENMIRDGKGSGKVIKRNKLTTIRSKKTCKK